MKESQDNNLDSNLTNFVYNTDGIRKIIEQNNIKKIFFSSRFVEKEFKKRFKDLIEELPLIKFITLPSLRYAAMSMEEKVERYRKVLPRL